MVLNLDQMQNFVQNVGTKPKEILIFHFISLFLIFFNYLMLCNWTHKITLTIILDKKVDWNQGIVITGWGYFSGRLWNKKK